MAETGNYPSFDIADDGTPYLPGKLVRVGRSLRQTRIVKDEDGDYEVVDCRPATELIKVRVSDLSGQQRRWLRDGGAISSSL